MTVDVCVAANDDSGKHRRPSFKQALSVVMDTLTSSGTTGASTPFWVLLYWPPGCELQDGPWELRSGNWGVPEHARTGPEGTKPSQGNSWWVVGATPKFWSGIGPSTTTYLISTETAPTAALAVAIVRRSVTNPETMCGLIPPYVVTSDSLLG